MLFGGATVSTWHEYRALQRPRGGAALAERSGTSGRIFATRNDDPRPKYYVLEMFPYPSGRIHMGHVRNYTMGDVVARYKRATGFNVLHPMGWDAFGLPAENAAMAEQGPSAHLDLRQHRRHEGAAQDRWACRSTGAARSRPATRAYYKHQQKMFLDFLAAGLVERKQSKVNWDPVDQTVLANEQVIDGRGWRSGAPVEQRELTQWFFKITDYSRGSARRARPARPLAGKSPADAEELDRPLRGPAGPLRARPADDAERRDRARDLHHAPRHDVRREVHGASRRTIRSRGRARRRIPRSPTSSPNASAPAPPRS